MDWEEKRRNALIGALLKGETVDLTKDADLYYAVNAKNVSLNEFVERDKFKDEAAYAKEIKDLNQANNGYTPGKKMRLIGEIPANIFFSRPEFAPDNPDRDKNIREFLQTYPAFRTVNKL